MARPRRYETNAKKQAAYRIRKRVNEKFGKLTAVSVLANQSQTNSDAGSQPAEGCNEGGEARESTTSKIPAVMDGDSRGGSQDSTIEKLRELVRVEQEKPRSEAPVKAVVYRDDFGRVLTEAQWNRLQEMKREAKTKNYELDEYSQ